MAIQFLIGPLEQSIVDENHGVVGAKMSELNQAVRYHQHGKPKEVLKLEELTLGELEPREVRIEIQVSTIHPSDYGLIQVVMESSGHCLA